THVLANLAIPTTIALVAQTRERLPQALRPWADQRVAAEVQRADVIRTTTADLSGEERLLARVAHLRAILAWPEEVAASSAIVAASAARRGLCNKPYDWPARYWPTATTPEAPTTSSASTTPRRDAPSTATSSPATFSTWPWTPTARSSRP